MASTPDFKLARRETKKASTDEPSSDADTEPEDEPQESPAPAPSAAPSVAAGAVTPVPRPVARVTQLVVAISARSLFNLEVSNTVFQKGGVEAYKKYQTTIEEKILERGPAFSLLEKILSFEDRAEVVILSSNNPNTAVPVIISIQHYGLRISKGVFTGGEPKFPYLKPLKADLFLTADPREAESALAAGFAAGNIRMPQDMAMSAAGSQQDLGQWIQDAKQTPEKSRVIDPAKQLRFAFDFDRVIVDGEAEGRYFEDKDKYFKQELEKAKEPLRRGPLMGLLEKICKLKAEFPDRIQIGVFTARTAPANLRVIYTLRHWGVEADQVFFLGSLPKGEFLREWRADIFFDDNEKNVQGAVENNVVAAYVSPVAPATAPRVEKP